MIVRAAHVALGLLAAGGVAWLLPFGLSRTAGGPTIEVSASAPYAVGSSALNLEVSPETTRRRATWETLTQPGLSFQRIAVDYGHRWMEEVRIPRLTGPFTSRMCGIHVRLSRALLDPTRGSPGLVRMLDQRVRKEFPRTVQGLTFPAVASTEAMLVPTVLGRIRVEIRVRLIDDTVFSIKVPLKLDSEGQHLVVQKAGSHAATWTGPTRNSWKVLGAVVGSTGKWWDPLVKGAASVFDGPIQNKIEEYFQGFVADMSRQVFAEVPAMLGKLHEPFMPLPGRKDTFALVLAEKPEVDEQGITLALCADVKLANPVLPTLPGLPVFVAKPSLGPAGGTEFPPVEADDVSPRLDVSLDTEALQHGLSLLFQTGQLRTWGMSTIALDALPAEMKMLAFRVTGFDPKLPPILNPTHSGAGRLRLTFPMIEVATWDAAKVMGQADVEAEITGDRSLGFRLTAPKNGMLHVQCHESSNGPANVPANVTVRGCLADLLPHFRDRLDTLSIHHEIPESMLFAGLSGAALGGLRLSVGKLKARVVGSLGHPALALQVETKVEMP